MAKGIIYVMTTVVSGLVKIGKTQTRQFEARMNHLENNGYQNVTGLKRYFAIEVEDYDAKEQLLDEIFSKSRLGKTELFALDINLVTQLLASFEGRQVFPATESKAEIFDEATEKHAQKLESSVVPNGTYYLEFRQGKSKEKIRASMDVEDGSFIIRAGQRVSLAEKASLPKPVRQRREVNVNSKGVVSKDVTFTSPSLAGEFVLGRSCNGWVNWKTADGELIDVFRKTK